MYKPEDNTCTFTGHAIVHFVTLSRVAFLDFMVCLFGLDIATISKVSIQM